MSISDYLTPGQNVHFEIEVDGDRLSYPSTVGEINESIFSIIVKHDGLNNKEIAPETKGQVLVQSRGLKFSLPVVVESLEGLPFIKVKYLPSRSHLRVDGFVALQFNKISSEEFLKKKSEYIENWQAAGESALFVPAEYFCEGKDIPANNIPLEIINEIHIMHKKLDLILRLLGNYEEHDIFKQKPVQVNISGGGFQLKCSDPFQVGDFIDMKIVLPSQPHFLIKAIGKVVRISKLYGREAGEDGKLSEVALEFAAINEDNREAIIRYVFKRQRELLRIKDTKEIQSTSF